MPHVEDTSRRYAPRRPEHANLHRIVVEHFESFRCEVPLVLHTMDETCRECGVDPVFDLDDHAMSEGGGILPIRREDPTRVGACP